MSRNVQGSIIVVVAAVGMFFGLIGPEIQQLQSYDDLTSLDFIGFVFVQLSVVIGSFVAGQLFPTARMFRDDDNDGSPDA